ncbi:uncharacterized protein Z519_05740 [Cladophialophora bantiana CBS 173.52]|uniref:Uncharacterized protein n=1 Tax=Cladophialophora bantiana (strain ATCC 10958 / CBS 173.52 / CDC B-1940 / NIH 8579) TaxID=1442370 RepID=A0A0D2HQM6_CLAB1|nr:uncharacterized protein Z519_05740 [Cladophialophora bantiana CBS 173.52]KIW93135.1 hypothetical protein Z519_05740 [Cladophialophora bantiana CBS 173.52]
MAAVVIEPLPPPPSPSPPAPSAAPTVAVVAAAENAPPRKTFYRRYLFVFFLAIGGPIAAGAFAMSLPKDKDSSRRDYIILGALSGPVFWWGKTVAQRVTGEWGGDREWRDFWSEVFILGYAYIVGLMYAILLTKTYRP